MRLRSKTRCFKTRALGRRLPNGKPQERLRFRALRSKTLAFKKRITIVFCCCDLKTSLGARACVQAFCVCVLKPTIGVPKTVLLVNSAFVPPEKGGF